MDTFFYSRLRFIFLRAFRVGTSIDWRLFEFFDFVLGGAGVENGANTL